MPELLVLDASAALAFLRSEPRRGEVVEHLGRHAADAGGVIVPELFWLEVTNVLVRRHALALDGVLASLRDLDELGIRTVAGDRGTTVLGLDLMLAHGLSMYDAAYLALAVAEDAALLTTDVRLGRAAGDRSLIMFPGAMHEALAPYGSTPFETVAAHGAYLAELRRQVEAGVLR